MSRQHAFKAVAAVSQVAHRDSDGASLPDDLLLTGEAAARVGYRGPNAEKNFLKWADRNVVPRFHRGRTCLWSASTLLAFLKRRPWTRDRHAEGTVRQTPTARKIASRHRDAMSPRGGR